jgi:hypothetical protein
MTEARRHLQDCKNSAKRQLQCSKPMRVLQIVHYVRLTNPHLCTTGQLPPHLRLVSLSSSHKSSSPNPSNMSTAPTDMLKQGADPATPLLSEDASEGAPETLIQMPTAEKDQAQTDTAAKPGEAPAANHDNPNPNVGHDPNLPDRICPPGYACDEC